MTIPPGRYEVTVMEHCLTESSNKKTPGVAILFKFEAASLPEGEHDQMHYTIWVTEKSAGFARGQLRAIGFDIDKNDPAVLNENVTMLAGKKTTVIVEEDDRDPRFTRISRIGAGVEPVAKDKAQALSAPMAALLRGAKGKNKDSIPRKRFEDEPTF